MHNGHNGAAEGASTAEAAGSTTAARPLLCDPAGTRSCTKDSTLTDTALPGVTGQGNEDRWGVEEGHLAAKRILRQ